MVDPNNATASYALQGTLLLPFLGILTLFFGGRLSRATRGAPARWPGLVAVFFVSCSLALCIVAAAGTRNHHTIAMQGGEWIPGFGPAFSFQLDWLSSWMLMLVAIVGLMVMVFSLGYMREERDQRRYFGGLLFFIGNDEAAHHSRQLSVAVCRVGRRRTSELLADRLPLRAAASGSGGDQSIHR